MPVSLARTHHSFLSRDTDIRRNRVDLVDTTIHRLHRSILQRVTGMDISKEGIRPHNRVMGSLMAESNRLQGDMVGMMTHTPTVTETDLRRGTMTTRQKEEEEVAESIRRREMKDGDQEVVEEGVTEPFLIFCL